MSERYFPNNSFGSWKQGFGRLSAMGAGRRCLAGLLRLGAALVRQIDVEILSRLAEIARAGWPVSPWWHRVCRSWRPCVWPVAALPVRQLALVDVDVAEFNAASMPSPVSGFSSGAAVLLAPGRHLQGGLPGLSTSRLTDGGVITTPHR